MPSNMTVKEDKMFETNEEELKDGHVVHYSYYVRNLNLIKRWSFKRCFQTQCQESSTSWWFEMMFQKVPDDSTVSCSITLRRTDDTDLSVMATLYVSLSRGIHGSVYFSEKYEEDGILPEEELKKSINEVIPIPHMETTCFEKIDIAVMIIIRKCHSLVKTNIRKSLRTRIQNITL